MLYFDTATLDGPYTNILPGIVEGPADVDGDGLDDHLEVRFKLEAAFSGAYFLWAKFSTGTGETVASSGRSLWLEPPGVYEVALRFPGELIHEAGVIGSFAVANVQSYFEHFSKPVGHAVDWHTGVFARTRVYDYREFGDDD